MPVLAPNNGARRQRREGKRAAALKFMDKVEPLVAELIQCADTTLALRNDTDVAEAMLRFLRQRVAGVPPPPSQSPPRHAVAAPPSKNVKRELKPLLCDMCKRACAARPTDVDAFFVAYLERRPAFIQRSSRDASRRDLLSEWWAPPDRWRLVWADEFDYEGAPDATKWEYQTTCNAWVHDDEHLELQHYTERNAVVEDGCLKITARLEEEEGCAYTSSRLRTQYKGDWLYGRIEVCAKLPQHFRGLWPAIWLLPTDDAYGHWPSSGEVDIMEHVGWKEKGTVHAGVHTRTSNHRDKTHRTSSTVVDDAHDAFHVYALVWRPDRMDVFVDGDLVHTVLRSEEGDWPFDKRFYLLLNVAVGGKWAGKHGIDEKAFPATLEVAYVRVYRERGS